MAGIGQLISLPIFPYLTIVVVHFCWAGIGIVRRALRIFRSPASTHLAKAFGAAAIVATPTTTHAALACAAFEAVKQVFCETPIQVGPIRLCASANSAIAGSLADFMPMSRT